MWRSTALLATTLCLLASLAGCRHGVAGDQLVPLLKATGYRFTWRRVPRPPGIDRVVAGRATDSHGVSIDFVVAVYDDERRSGEPLPVVPHAVGGIGCANYALLDNSDDLSAPAALRDRRWEIEFRIEHALDAHTSGYVCEG